MFQVPLVTILAREMLLKILWSRPSFGEGASAVSNDIGVRNAIENFLKSAMLWRCWECHWSEYWREKCDWFFFWSRPNFGDAASAAISAGKAIEQFFEVDQALEMLQVQLVTILAQEMRLKFLNSSWRCCEERKSRYWREKRNWKIFNNPSTCCECLLVTILARDMRLKFYTKTLEKLRGPLVTTLARVMRLKILNSSSRCCEGGSSQNWREKRDWKVFSNPWTCCECR